MITRRETEKLAKLAKLALSEKELDEMTESMQDIIAFVDKVKDADIPDHDFDNIHGLHNVYREDVVQLSYDRDELLQNSGGGEEGCFYIKRRLQ